MATSLKNLSTFSSTLSLEDPSSLNVAIVVAEWNEQITFALRDGAVETLLKAGIPEKNIIYVQVPGSYELPTAANMILSAKSNIDAVICIGCLIKGETAHFDYISQAVAQGIKDVSLAFDRTVIFGVLTVDTLEQAQDRAGGKHGNKGDEAAYTALRMIQLQKDLRK